MRGSRFSRFLNSQCRQFSSNTHKQFRQLSRVITDYKGKWPDVEEFYRRIRECFPQVFNGEYYNAKFINQLGKWLQSSDKLTFIDFVEEFAPDLLDNTSKK